MIWLQPSPWIRWTVAMVIAIGAIWTEFRGDGTVDHPFAVETIAPGAPITDDNVEMRPVPYGLLEPVMEFGYATRAFHPGDPITPGGVTDESIAATAGWWALEVAVPQTARVGDAVQLVLIDSGTVVAGTVNALPDEDPLAGGLGSVAIPPEHAAAAAAAVGNGRVVVLVATG